MLTAPTPLSLREKAIVVGLFLSRYNEQGLRSLGFEQFRAAYNTFGFALGVNPQSIKNYRDEFDPLFSNGRVGRARPIRPYCLAIYQRFASLAFPDFVDLLRALVYPHPEVEKLVERLEAGSATDISSFAKRLLTGAAAERYFREHYASLPLFDNHRLEDTTALGYGFDFQLIAPTNSFFGVEVKGLNERTGTISLTEKEHRVAQMLGDNYVLFVVKNFREQPFHELVRNPLNSHLAFQPREQKITVINWTTTV